jgi:hypothetical protein
MTYRRFINRQRRYEGEQPVVHEKHHMKGDTFYMPRAEDLAQGVGPSAANELNLTKDDWSDGVTLRWNMVPPTVTVKDYTHEVPMETRRICETCSAGRMKRELLDMKGHYKIWCGKKGVENTEFHKLMDNQCQIWEPAHQDCIG